MVSKPVSHGARRDFAKWADVISVCLLVQTTSVFAQGAAKPVAAPAAVSAPVPPSTGKVPVPAVDAGVSEGVRVLLVPSMETTLAAQMAGRIAYVPSQLGQSFAQGATVVRFDCSENHAKLRMAIAELNSAKESHEAKLRLQGLESAGELEVAMAAAAREKARAGVELGKTQVKECAIAAPFSAQVVKIHVKQHQSVNIGTPIVDLVSGGPPRMRLNVPSKWLSWLKRGTKFQVTIDETGKTHPAKIVGMNARIDAVSQSIEVEGAIDGKVQGHLLPGMSGVAKFDSPSKKE